MNMLHSNKLKIVTIIILVTLGFFTANLFAQDKSELKEKLNNLKGKVEKLTVKVDGRDVVFEGKEAEKLVQKLREPMPKHLRWISEEDMGEGPNHDITWVSGDSDDIDISADNMQKKIKVEDKDGKKKVTVTTMKDGKEETKVYEGEEADKFLKDEQSSHKMKFIFEGDTNMSGKNMMYFKHRIPHRCCCCCEDEMPMRMMFKHDKGMKKIIIKEHDDKKIDKETLKK